MKPTAQYSIRVAEPGVKGAVSQARKHFNALSKKLEAMRLQLATWKEVIPAIMSQAERQFKPLVQAYSVHQRALTVLLDQMYHDKALSKKDRSKLRNLICSMAVDDDAELKAIYNRHSGGDFDAEIAADGAAFKEMVEEMLGVQMDDDVDLSSPEAMMAACAAQMEQLADQERQAEQVKAATRIKSGGALAREQRQAAEAIRLKQSVRDIFRKLASQLHPDREPDAAERERKTVLMQRVNVAYADNDLLGLLGLQLEVEQIDQASLDALSDERIKQYIKILEGQLREIAQEVGGIEYAAVMDMGRQLRGVLTPQAMLHGLHTDIGKMQANIGVIVAELAAFRDVDKLKAWLKTYRF